MFGLALLSWACEARDCDCSTSGERFSHFQKKRFWQSSIMESPKFRTKVLCAYVVIAIDCEVRQPERCLTLQQKRSGWADISLKLCRSTTFVRRRSRMEFLFYVIGMIKYGIPPLNLSCGRISQKCCRQGNIETTVAGVNGRTSRMRKLLLVML